MTQKASTTVGIYEIDGEDVSLGTTKVLRVESHWNSKTLVVIRRGKRSWTVPARDLQAAIENATRVER